HAHRPRLPRLAVHLGGIALAPALPLLVFREDDLQHLLRAYRPITDRGQQFAEVCLAQRLDRAFEKRIGNLAARRLEGGLQYLAPELAELRLLGRADRPADRRPRLAGCDNRFPGRRWLLC